jgi:Trk K+ transport system NAD-binding subunit
LNKKHNIILLTKLKPIEKQNYLGIVTQEMNSGEAITADTVLESDDIIVIYGHKNDISRLVEQQK